MSAVRQHYKLATTGKPGQQANVQTGTKSTDKMSHNSKSGGKTGSKGYGKGKC